MFSDKQVQVAASNFVAIKIDLKKSQDALEHKKSRYVPELVVLDKSQNFIATIDARDPQTMKQQLNDALSKANRR